MAGIIPPESWQHSAEVLAELGGLAPICTGLAVLRWRIVRQQAALGPFVGLLLAEPCFAREFALLALPWLRIKPGLTYCKILLLKRG